MAMLDSVNGVPDDVRQSRSSFATWATKVKSTMALTRGVEPASSESQSKLERVTSADRRRPAPRAPKKRMSVADGSENTEQRQMASTLPAAQQRPQLTEPKKAQPSGLAKSSR
jgi:hypothetical protein